MPIPGLYKIFDHWHQTGACHIISDTHFGEDDLKAGISSRPTDDELVKMINTKCGRADTLIHLGDVGDLTYVQKLKAKHKILVMGNHDTGRSNYVRQTFTMKFDVDAFQKSEALEEMKRLYPNCRYDIQHGYSVSRAPFEYWDVVADNMLFDEVYEGPLMIAEKLILSHEPVDVPWAFNIHGHNHSKKKNGKLHFNACFDATGYEVINFNQWMKQGYLAHVETLHRDTINTATKRKAKRGGKKIGEK